MYFIEPLKDLVVINFVFKELMGTLQSSFLYLITLFALFIMPPVD